MKKIYLIALLIGLSLFLSACTAKQPIAQTNKITSIPAGKFLFYSKTCPHCLVVDQYIQENNIKQKLYFTSLEVSQNKNNYDLAVFVGQHCQIPEASMGVPLFWDGIKCYSGEDEIINYFKAL